MSDPAGPRHFRPIEGQTYQLGPMTLAFKPGEAELGGAYSMIESTDPDAGRLLTISTPSRVFERFVAEVSAANRDPSTDVHAVFARHGFELLASEPR